MTHAEQLLFVGICGAVLMLVLCIGFDDWKSAAHAGEKLSCKDRPDQKAYMMRLPGESHSVESCIHVMRFGDPRWVPELGSPLPPAKGM